MLSIHYTSRRVTPHLFSALLHAQVGDTPLTRAALEGHTEVASFLLANGSNVEEEDNVSRVKEVLSSHVKPFLEVCLNFPV